MTGMPSLDIAVLCGGLSRRMGSDKAMLSVADSSLLQHQIDALCTKGEHLWLVSHRRYDVALPDNARWLDDALPGTEGPLSGMLAAMQASAASYIWVMPCDIYLTSMQLAQLKAQMLHLMQPDGVDVVYCRVQGGKDQPLLALVRRHLMPSLQAYLVRGERAVMRWYQSLNTQVLMLDESYQLISNINTPEDYQRLLRWLDQDHAG